MSGHLQQCRAGGREFQILGDATEKLRAPNDVLMFIAAAAAFPNCYTVPAVNSRATTKQLDLLTNSTKFHNYDL